MEQSSPLLSLVPELRNEIWHYVLTQDDGIEVAEYDWACEPALLATCTQIRQEAIGIYYGLNTFITHAALSTFSSTYNEPFDWIATLGKERTRLIRDLHIVIHEDGPPGSWFTATRRHPPCWSTPEEAKDWLQLKWRTLLSVKRSLEAAVGMGLRSRAVRLERGDLIAGAEAGGCLFPWFGVEVGRYSEEEPTISMTDVEAWFYKMYLPTEHIRRGYSMGYTNYP